MEAVLSVAPFSAPCVLSFGSVYVGAVAERTVRVANPTEAAVVVSASTLAITAGSATRAVARIPRLIAPHCPQRRGVGGVSTGLDPRRALVPAEEDLP